MYRLGKKKITLDAPVAKIANKKFRALCGDMPLNELTRVLMRADYAVIKNSGSGKPRLVTPADMVGFMTGETSVPRPSKEGK